MGASRKSRPATVLVDRRRRPDARVLAVSHSIGASPADSAVIEFERIGSRNVGRFQDVELGEVFQDSEVEVILPLRSGRNKVVHWGRIAAVDYNIDGQGDRVRAVSRLEPHHFGRQHTVTHQAVIHPKTRRLLGVVEEEDSAVFNPQIDGRHFPNQYAGRTRGALPIFLDPDAHPRGPINRAVFWSLASATAYLLWSLNGDERYVKNPALRVIGATLGFDLTLLRNHEVRLGSHLPEALDALLTPYGFGWHVAYVRPGLRTLHFFRRHGGTPVFLRHQRAGAAVDNRQSNAPQIAATYDIASQTVNDVLLYGDFIEAEGTFELVPAWDPKYDGLSRDQELATDSPGWETEPDKQRVWRDWVLNESGEYTKLRKSNKDVDLDVFFGRRGAVYRRRRPFGPTLTLGEDGSPIGENHGVTVEWWDALQQQWLSVSRLDGGSFELLESEAGIRFTDKLPPKELMTQTDSEGKLQARIRITATLRADVRLSAFNRAVRTSHLRDAKPYTLDLSHRYKQRVIHSSSIYWKRVRAGKLKSAEANDAAALVNFAAVLRRQWDQATVAGAVTIEGVDWPGAAIGVPIAGIDGKRIGFRTTARRSPDRGWPTAVAVEYLPQENVTRIFLETFRPPAR